MVKPTKKQIDAVIATPIEHLEREHKVWTEEMKAIIADIADLQRQERDLAENPPTSFDIISTMIERWALTLDAERSQQQDRLSAATKGGTLAIGLEQYRRRIRAIDKDLALLATTMAMVPTSIQTDDYAEGKPNSWVGFLRKVGYEVERDKKGKGPLDLTRAISTSYENKDLQSFVGAVKSYLVLCRKKKSQDEERALSRRLWATAVKKLQQSDRDGIEI
jgi:hypothetical protein